MNLLLLIIMTTLTKNELTVTSSAFKGDGMIPSKYTCEGDNINPPLRISGIPSAAKSLAIIMDDPDAPNGTFDHWIAWNIDPVETIAENSSPGIKGKNGRSQNGYTGPCPPSGMHHYHFKVYAHF